MHESLQDLWFQERRFQDRDGPDRVGPVAEVAEVDGAMPAQHRSAEAGDR